MKFELFHDKQRQWRFRLVADNGRTLCQSEGYHNRQDCIHTIVAIKQGAADAEQVLVDSTIEKEEEKDEFALATSMIPEGYRQIGGTERTQSGDLFWTETHHSFKEIKLFNNDVSRYFMVIRKWKQPESPE